MECRLTLKLVHDIIITYNHYEFYNDVFYLMVKSILTEIEKDNETSETESYKEEMYELYM